MAAKPDTSALLPGQESREVAERDRDRNTGRAEDEREHDPPSADTRQEGEYAGSLQDLGGVTAFADAEVASSQQEEGDVKDGKEDYKGDVGSKRAKQTMNCGSAGSWLRMV